MGDYTPVYLPGDSITSSAAAAITGGQLLEVAGSGTVQPTSAAGTSSHVVGVAAQDASVNARVTFFGRGVVHELIASAAGGITAGDQVISGTTLGTVVTLAPAAAAAAADVNNARALVGIALTTAIAGAKLRVMEF